MTPQPSSTDLTTSPVDNKLPVTTTTQEVSSPESPQLSEKAASEESKTTLPSTRKETSPKDTKSTKPKKKTGFRFKGMGCKGLFSLLSCISTDEKASRREKTPTEKPVTTTNPSTPVVSSESVEPSTEEPTEGAVTLRSESTSQPEDKPKPAVDDLIYSAASPDEPQKAVTKPEVLLSKPSQTSLPESKPLLEPLTEEFKGKKCLVLDLDETLVHSSFKLVEHPDFIVPVEIDNQVHNVYVAKRPGVDEFLKQVGELYEVVVFTASLSKYADPVLDMLDIHKVVKHRLFRESCYNHNGNYVKDLSQLGRNLADTIIIDNSPTSYLFHPANAVPITTWFNDIHDTELLDLIPFLTDLTTVADVTKVLDNALDEEEYA